MKKSVSGRQDKGGKTHSGLAPCPKICLRLQDRKRDMGEASGLSLGRDAAKGLGRSQWTDTAENTVSTKSK